MTCKEWDTPIEEIEGAYTSGEVNSYFSSISRKIKNFFSRKKQEKILYDYEDNIV